MSGAQRPKNIEEYAELQAALMSGPRDEVLHARGLDEDSFAEIDAEFQDALSEAMMHDGDGVPPLVASYDTALRMARVESAEDLTLEQFASLTRELESGADVRRTFEKRGITFERYVRASQRWTARMATDPELAQRFLSFRGR